MRRAALVAAVVTLVATAACSAEEPDSGVDAAFEATLDDYLEHAAAAGASDEQIEILEQARETGEIPFETYSGTIDRALRCLREAGYDPDDLGVREEFGVKIRMYGIPTEAEQNPAEMVELWPDSGIQEHRCFAEHSSWVHMAYGAQPSSIEAQDVQFEPYREAVIECMEEQGVEFDRDMGRQELMQAMADAWQDGTTSVDCFNESGYSGG